MELIVLFIYCSAYISSGNSLSDDTNENIYNSVKIDFPSDPCDTSSIPLPDYNTPGRRISEVKCFEHTWQLRYDQIKELRNTKCNFIRYNVIGLLGGQRAEDGEYPHMTAIGWKGTHGNWIFKCGGSLISERFVLTAAHCSRVRESDDTVTDRKPEMVRLGGHSLLDFHPRAYDVLIKDFITHHRYKPPRQYYDIALIELDAKVSFSWRIHPSCLWTKFENPGTGILTGWGVIDLSTRMTSPMLQKANIKIIDYEECDKKLSQKRNRNWWGFMRHQLCAGNMSGGVDTCQGDSGGPLQSLIPLKHPRSGLKWNLHHIIGVTSFGFGCARKDTPSVYTRVASFIGWIEQIVWPDSSYLHNATNDNGFYFTT
ncbi:serine protease snake-like [Vanessa atalanta]|uniref:serine protease snake-like n=1 Tax=Vanessa atalanta TaxID=42275 RepID=UPI001FCD84C7|nr:serine protease snake-like [Vanessa atalanta]